jgi:hypothetical protein
MSLDRLHMLELIAASWSGPVSLALYTSDADSARFLTFYTSSALLSARCNIAVHLVYAEGEFFPINHLRNVALRQVFTKKEDTGYDTVRKSYSTASVIADPGALKNKINDACNGLTYPVYKSRITVQTV